MRAHGHTTVWDTQVEVGHIGGHAGWYLQFKAWWAARHAGRRQGRLATRDAYWDAQHEVVRSLRVDAAPDMAAAHGALTVATMLYGLQQ